MTNQISLKSAIVLCAVFFILGCATAEQKQVKKDAVIAKQKNYTMLMDAVTSNSLKLGTPPQVFHEKYGAPDDVFGSGSMSGRFEVWTYEKPETKDSDWGHIRLYFNNNQLVSWDY